MLARSALRGFALLTSLVLLALLVVPLPAVGQEAEEGAVVAVVQDLFDAMATRDAEAISALLTDDARIASVRPGAEGQRVVGSQDRATFVRAITVGQGEILERMWEPQVRVHGDLASLWAPYDFWIDGELSHCGVDAFQLLRTDDGWRIAHVAYTVEREGCPDSPLGPPE